MKNILILILALILPLSVKASDESQSSRKQQRELKKQTVLQNALQTLQSGKFSIKVPTPIGSHEYVVTDRIPIASLDVSDPRYEVILTDIDTKKSIYTVAFCIDNPGWMRNIKVSFNFETGYLKVAFYKKQQLMRAEEFTNRDTRVIMGNYTYVYPYDQ